MREIKNPKGLPVIPPLPKDLPTAPLDPNPEIAICGECGLHLRKMMGYVCPRANCPVGLNGGVTMHANMSEPDRARYIRALRCDRTDDAARKTRWIEHVHCDGARFHVISWRGGPAGAARSCSEPRCVVNRISDSRRTP